MMALEPDGSKFKHNDAEAAHQHLHCLESPARRPLRQVGCAQLPDRS